MRTAILAMMAALSACAYDAGTIDSDQLRSGTPVVTNAWQAVSNKTESLAGLLIAETERNRRTTRLETADGRMWQDATGVVWRVENGVGGWIATTNVITDVVVSQGEPSQVVFKYGTYIAWAYLDSGVDYSSLSDFTIPAGWYYWLDDDFTERGTGEFPVTFVREVVPDAATNAVRQVAYKNDIPSIAGLATLQEVLDASNNVVRIAGQKAWDSLVAASNYVNDTSNHLANVISDMASHIGPSDRISDGTNTITATRDVYGEVTSYGEWDFSYSSPPLPEGAWLQNWTWEAWAEPNIWRLSAELIYAPDPSQSTTFYAYVPDDSTTASSSVYLMGVDYEITFTRGTTRSVAYVGRVALTNDLPRLDGMATMSAVTGAIRSLSLGGIWDRELEVWWTPVMEDGALRYMATTNINMNGGGQ